MDFDLQLYYRDIRIISIYEGTTGIQSLDLMARKVTMHNGKVLEWLGAEILKDIQAANQYEKLKPYAAQLGTNLQLVQEVIGALIPYAQEGNFEKYLADATLFMDFFGTILVGWQWLKTSNQASKDLETKALDSSFLKGKIHTMAYFYKYEMSRTKGLAKTIMNDIELTLDFDLSYLD